MNTSLKVVFPPSFDEWDFVDMEEIGSGVATVVLPDGREFDFTFLTTDKLRQVLDSRSLEDRPCFIPDGLNLVVMKKVSKETIEQAAEAYFKSGYFDQFRLNRS